MKDKHDKDLIDITDEDMNGEPDHQIGWFSGMCMVIGLMVGSGIFSTPATVLKNVQSPGLALVFWLIGGIVAFCGTFSYVELGTMLPQSGGEQTYLSKAFPKPKNLLSFLFCWSMIMCARPGAAAADSVVFAKYILFPIFDGPDSGEWLQRAVGLLCITSITLINIFSTKLAIQIHDGVTVFKLLTLSVISVTGFLVATRIWSSIPRADANFIGAFDDSTTNPGLIATTLFGIFYTYDGWNNLNYSVGELKNPAKNLPKAAGLGVSIVCFLYLIVNISYLVVLPKEDMIKSGNLLAAHFFSVTFGHIAGVKIFPVCIALSAFGAVCAMVYSAARVIHSAAEAGYFPFSSTLSQINPYTKTPVNALIFHWVCVVFLMFAPPPGAAFEFLVEFAQYPTWIFYGLAVIGLLVMRSSHPHLPRPYKVFTVLPIILVLVSLFLAVFPFIPSPNADFPSWLPSLSGTVFILLGIPIWYKLVYIKETAQELEMSSKFDSIALKVSQ